MRPRDRWWMVPFVVLGGLVAADVSTLGGCAWPDFVAVPGDGGSVEGAVDLGVVDSHVDVTDTTPSDTPASYTLPDGRVCTGHDEDGDGIPDQCDNCPNVANPTQGPKDVGDLCAASATFIPPPSTRLVFDPLMTLSNWTSFGAPSDAGAGGVFAVGSDGDSLVGGTTSDFDFRFIVGKTGAGLSATVATVLLAIREDDSGSAGILLRVTGDPKHFMVCAVSTGANGFAAAHAPDPGCTGGPCNPIAFPLTLADGGVSAAQLAIPTDLPHKLGDVIGLRASIVKNDTTGAFECRVFDPRNASTLQSTDPKYAVKVDVPSSRWLAGGEVGLYSQKAKTQFLSIDMLRGP